MPFFYRNGAPGINQESVRAAGSNLARKDKLPIGFYSGNGPAPQWSFVEPACQASETGIPIIGKLTLGVVVMEDEAEARAGSAVTPLKL